MRPAMVMLSTAIAAILSVNLFHPISALDALLIYSISGQTLLLMTLFTGAIRPERS